MKRTFAENVIEMVRTQPARRDAQLSIRDIAERLKTTPGAVTRVVNEYSDVLGRENYGGPRNDPSDLLYYIRP
jgi:hypothetical protein